MKYYLLFLLSLVNALLVNSQNYSSQWEGHFSYYNISGLSSNDDNIYLKQDTNNDVFFGWGRGNDKNEVKIITNVNTSLYYGIY